MLILDFVLWGNHIYGGGRGNVVLMNLLLLLIFCGGLRILGEIRPLPQDTWNKHCADSTPVADQGGTWESGDHTPSTVDKNWEISDTWDMESDSIEPQIPGLGLDRDLLDSDSSSSCPVG